MKVILDIVKGPERGKRFMLDQPTTGIGGRSPDACFHFSEDDSYISRRHFLLELSPPKVYFRDLDVTNPSTVNDRPIEVAELAEGDVIEVGYTRLKVSIEPDPPPAVVEQPIKPIPAVARERGKPIPMPATNNVAPPPSGLAIACACGHDLSARANSDGRALELRDIVGYACERCLPKAGEEAGRCINGYQVIRKLGEGGMGRVYLAYHPPTARLVAIKEMNIGDRALGARFNREIRLMRQVIHDNVVRYLDHGLDEVSGRPYLVLEYAPLGSLQAILLANHGQLPIEDSLRHVIQALRGLEDAHRRGIVHRDIKPENILLKSMAQGGLSAKITDFGLAREFSKTGGSVLTKVGTGMGTLMYMPPEQICDAHSVREAADLYSMGVTLYQLLTGKHTFNFPTPFDVLQFLVQNNKKQRSPEEDLKLMMAMQRLKTPYLIILEDNPIPILKRKPDLPPTLAQIVDKAVQKDIEQRFQRASDFREQLEAIA